MRERRAPKFEDGARVYSRQIGNCQALFGQAVAIRGDWWVVTDDQGGEHLRSDNELSPAAKHLGTSV